MILGVHHVTIATADQAQLIPLLGGFEEPRLAVERSGERLLAAPNVYLRSVPPKTPAPRRAPLPHALGLAHLCLQSPDAAALWETLATDAEIAFTAPLTGLGGPFRYAYGYTPEGLMWELEETQAVPEAAPRAWLAHAAFVTQNLDRLAGFYGSLTGRPVTPGAAIAGNRRADKITGLAGVAMTPAWVQGLNLGLEFWRFDAPAAPPPLPRDGAGIIGLCLQTDDLTADTEAALEAGARLVSPPAPWSGGQHVRLEDPDGNPLALVALPADHALAVSRLPHADILARHARALDALP
jgi:catechol 2,3-dioxygenase-like lactoylglutathione lyase family enzyme